MPIQSLSEALAYLSPHPSTKGPIILTPEKMREAVGVIEAENARLREAVDAADLVIHGFCCKPVHPEQGQRLGAWALAKVRLNRSVAAQERGP